MVDNTMSLRTSRLLWPRSIYVTRDRLYDLTHSVKACSLRTATPPCTKDRSKQCDTCNRMFLSEKCFRNHFTLKVKGKLVCQWRQVCQNCSFTVTSDWKHEYFKAFCNYCNKKQPLRHFGYLAPLKPSKLTDRFFFDSEYIQEFEKHDGSFEHIPNLVCAQQMCSKCEAVGDLSVVCSVVSVPACFGRKTPR